MAVLKLSIIGLLISLFLGDTVSEQCQWTEFQLGKLNKDSVLLLTNMSGSFPLKCLKEKGKRMFPVGVYKRTQNEDISVVALEALGNVAKIFNNNKSSVSWDHDKLRLFRNKISRQIENLGKCVGDEVTFSGNDSTPAGGNTALVSYFEKLNTILKDKEFSDCAWEIVRDEVHYNLVQFHAYLESRGEP